MYRIVRVLILACLAAALFVSRSAAHDWMGPTGGIIADKSFAALLALTISFLPLLFIFYAIVNYFKVKKHYEEFPSVARFFGFTALDVGNLLVAILFADIWIVVFDRRVHFNKYLIAFIVLYFGLNCLTNSLFLRVRGQNLKTFFLKKTNLLKIWRLNVKYLTLLILVAILYVIFLIISPEKTRHAIESQGKSLTGYLEGCYYDYEHCPIEKLVAKLESKRENVKTIAKNMIIRRKDPGTVRCLSKFLEKKWPSHDRMIYEALEIMGKLNDPQAIEPLIILINNENENLLYRESAIHTLGKLSHSPLIMATFATLLDNRNSGIRISAAEQLIKHQDMRALAVLINSLSDPDYSRNAQNALGSLKGQWAVSYLISAMKEKKGFVRETIAEKLTSLCGVSFGEDYEKWQKWEQENSHKISY